MRAANLGMGFVFLFAAALQYNDPDALPWMAVYGLAALACLLAFRGRPSLQLSLAIGLIALLWAAILVPQFAGRVEPAEVFSSFGMKTTEVELAREAGGLLIIFLWMSAIAFGAHRNRVR